MCIFIILPFNKLSNMQRILQTIIKYVLCFTSWKCILKKALKCFNLNAFVLYFKHRLFSGLNMMVLFIYDLKCDSDRVRSLMISYNKVVE